MSAVTVESVADLYRRWGAHRYDELVTQLDHAVQVAALAAASGASDELVAAALLHDVGHLLHLDSVGGGEVRLSADLHHERVGADHLAGLFPPAVIEPIALHVQAKRYRCAVDPDEVGRLSEGSRRSLRRQGGPMAADEVAAFERTPGWADAVSLRGWDDDGKATDGVEVAPFDAYLDLLAAVSSA